MENLEGLTRFWRDRPVFVTGGSGLIGGYLVKRLLDVRADVVCLVRDWVPGSQLVRAKWLDRVVTVRGDVRDQALLERVLGEYEIDCVFHLAAQTIVGVANRNPVSTFDTNILGTCAVLEAARRSPRVRGVVLASSDKAYGNHEILPYAEDAPLQGRHPYDVSKSAADLIAQSYAHTYGTPVAITRCGNVYGGGDLNWNRIVPGTIRSVLRGERPLIRTDGSLIRDYFYAEDAAAAYTTLAERLLTDPALAGQAFNFSIETPLSVLDITRRLLAVMNSSLEPDIRNDASNEIPAQYLDSSKARRVLGWTPLHSLDESLGRTIAWYEDYLSGAKDGA